MSIFGQEVSDIYPLIYSDKNYEVEVEYIIKLLETYSIKYSNILDIGCGSGSYTRVLKKYFSNVTGIDYSSSMIEKAKKIDSSINYQVGDIRNYKSNLKFNTISCMFHVFNYLVNEKDRELFFLCIHKLLSTNGILFFDFWHGAGVLSDPPIVKQIEKENSEFKVIRKTYPYLSLWDNIVEVNFEYNIFDKIKAKKVNINEKHNMHILFLKELKAYTIKYGFELLAVKKWLSQEDLTKSDWYGFAILKKKLK